MPAEVPDVEVTFAVVEERDDHPDGSELSKPTVEGCQGDLIVGEDPVLQPGRMALHDAVVVGVAPEADEEQAGIPGHLREFLVIPEFGLDHPRPGHDPLPDQEAHRRSETRPQDGSPLSYYVR